VQPFDVLCREEHRWCHDLRLNERVAVEFSHSQIAEMKLDGDLSSEGSFDDPTEYQGYSDDGPAEEDDVEEDDAEEDDTEEGDAEWETVWQDDELAVDADGW